MSNTTAMLAAQLAGDYIKNKVAPPTQVVEHRYPSSTPPQTTGAHGSPVLGGELRFEEEAPFAEEPVDSIDMGSNWGDPIREIGRTQAMFLKQFGSSINAPVVQTSGQGSYGDPNGFGMPNLLGWAANTARNTVDSAAGSIEALTGELAKEVDKIEGRVDKLVQRVINNERSIKSNRSQTGQANRRIIEMQRKLNAVVSHIESKAKTTEAEMRDMYEEAILSFLNVLPGIYSFKQLNGTKHKAVLAAQKVVNKAFLVDQEGSADAVSLAAPAAVGGTFDQTALQGTINTLIANQDLILERLNDLSTDYYTLVESVADAELADAIPDFEAVLADNSIVDISTIIPNQIRELMPALVNAGGKLLLGTPPGESTSGSGFSLSASF